MQRFFILFLVAGLAAAIPAQAQIGNCQEGQAQSILDVGNIRAGIYNDGALFWKGGLSLYEAPKYSGLQSMFTSSFAVGGLINGRLHMAAATYGRYEFWPGPLDADGNPPTDCAEYDRIWEINADDFQLFEKEGVFSENMKNWPWQLGAPVVDGDGEPNNYNLEGGDRPELLGNQLLWWIMNDRGNEHKWSRTNPIGLEVQASVFAFQHVKSAGDISFYRYKITNKNTYPLTDAFFSMYADPDLGNASDDYFGSDSLLHLGYAYNGDPIDDHAYGKTPPALGYAFLKTPEAPVDNYDNDRDGEIDEPGEQTGMYSAVTFIHGGGAYDDPVIGEGMYTFMQGTWKDGSRITVGGGGINWSRTPTRFMFSGDPTTRSFWSENQTTLDGTSHNYPGDRRFMISAGPANLLSGQSTEILVAIVWARGSDHLDSVRKLKNIVASMQATPESYLTSGYREGLNEPEPAPPEQVLGFDQNFPNPFRGTTTLRYSLPKTMQVRLTVYDMLGREVATLAEGTQDAGTYTSEFDGADLPAGIYYARIELDHLQFTKKMVRVP